MIGNRLSLKLALANLKKKPSSCLSFVILVMIAVMLLETGMVLFAFVPGYYDASNQRLKEPHYIVRMHDNDYENKYLDILKADRRVEAAAVMDCAMMDQADYKTSNGKMILYGNFLNADAKQEFFSLIPMYEDRDIDKKEAIYVPFSFKQQGYQTGEQITFEFKRKQYNYRIAGFFETTWFGSTATNLYSFYLHEEAYNQLYGQVGGGKILGARLYDADDSVSLSEDFKTTSGIEFDSYNRNASIIDNTYRNMKDVSTVIISVMSALSILISITILGITVLVIWFRIANQIQDNLKQIGVLKAVGCTSGQLRASIVLEHMMAGLLGGVVGIGLSYGLITLLGAMISGSLGVVWNTPIRLFVDVTGLVLVLSIIAVISFVTSGKVKTLTPVMALLEGNGPHTFHTNVFPLSHGKGGSMALSMRLAGKHIFHMPRQYLTLAFILVCVSFVMSFSVILYQGLVMNPHGFMNLLGMEVSPVTVTLAPHKDYEKVRQELEAMEEVEGTSLYESSSVELEGIAMTGYVSDDFTSLRTFRIYDGTLPIYENEIIVTGIIADRLGKNIGDSVIVTWNGVSHSYIICGLSQSLNNFGLQCSMTFDGMKRLNQSATFTTINVYLKEGQDYISFEEMAVKKFHVLDMAGDESEEHKLKRVTEQKIADLLTMYGADSAQYALMENGEIILSGDTAGYELQSMEDTLTLVQTSSASYIAMIQMLTVFLTAMSAGITAFILQFMVKSAVTRRKREFGIYKAMGYTSGQLIMQTAFCYVPISIPGVFVGTLAGGVLTNPVMSTLTKSIGISDMGLSISITPLIILVCIILGFVFFIAYISARQIKKISVYELFTE